MAETPEPMGGQQFEETHPTGYEPFNRNCWALDTLIEEVTALFNTKVVTSEPNRFGANLLATFTPAKKEIEDMAAVMPALSDDERVEHVFSDAKEIRVKIIDNPILMDTRDTFDIAGAALGLDRELTPDDLTDLAADIAAGGEGFIEGSS